MEKSDRTLRRSTIKMTAKVERSRMERAQDDEIRKVWSRASAFHPNLFDLYIACSGEEEKTDKKGIRSSHARGGIGFASGVFVCLSVCLCACVCVRVSVRCQVFVFTKMFAGYCTNRRERGYGMNTQVQLLEEAKITEQQNIESLNILMQWEANIKKVRELVFSLMACTEEPLSFLALQLSLCLCGLSVFAYACVLSSHTLDFIMEQKARERRKVVLNGDV